MHKADQLLDPAVESEWAESSATETAPRPSTSWSRSIKKTVYTLNIGDYAPEICALTYPLMQAYARKIGADFYVIRERKFPKWPVVYEKLQIHELGREHGNDWNIYIDSDALVNPEMFDVTEHLHKNTVCHNGTDMAGIRWRYDQYFRRDGRHIGSCNWFTVASDECLDLWRPLDDLTLEQAMGNINVTVGERNCGVCKTEHLIDDYTLSRNIARFGLRVQTVIEMCGKLGWRGPGGVPVSPFLFHKYTISNEQKVREMLTLLGAPLGQPTPVGAGWGLLTPDGVAGYRRRFLHEARRSAATTPDGSQAGATAPPPGSHIQGWMTGPELAWLHETANGMNSIVEVGCWRGRSTYALCSSGCPRVIAVDHFLGSQEHQREFGLADGWSPFPEFEKNILNEFRNVELRKMDSIATAQEFGDRSVEMVFLDGAHDYESVLQDLKAWGSKASRLVAVHNYSRRSVQKATGEYFGRSADAVVGDIATFTVARAI